jgi:hypothetical protein
MIGQGLPDRVLIREVGPRDGFQNEPERISTDDKVRLINALARTGLRRIEVASFVRPDVIPQLDDAIEVLHRIDVPDDVSLTVLVPNERGLKTALEHRDRFHEVAVFLSASETHNRKNVNRSEFYTRSAVVTLASIAAHTSRCRVGTSIAYATGRSPLVLATEARSLDEVSGGRLVLGLGTGTRRMMEDWHGGGSGGARGAYGGARAAVAAALAPARRNRQARRALLPLPCDPDGGDRTWRPRRHPGLHRRREPEDGAGRRLRFGWSTRSPAVLARVRR